jgi:hypothetical protein
MDCFDDIQCEEYYKDEYWYDYADGVESDDYVVTGCESVDFDEDVPF